MASTIELPRVLRDRRKFCVERIPRISKSLLRHSAAYIPDHLCAYVTGSYGRLEASQHSDIDIFFVLNDVDFPQPLPRINEHHIFSDLAKVCRELRFPEFSNDGEYLRVHALKNVLGNVGNPSDDFSNNFTARMLLLLESKPLVNEETYDQILKKIVGDYWRDYPDHDTDFRPVFFMNDVVRFWKTLCLNYESKRNLKELGRHDRAKANLKNLKLKFSRMLTCYSMIAELIAAPGPINPKRILDIVKRTPVERLLHVAEQHRQKKSPIHTHITELLSLYGWFLTETGRSEADMIAWMRKESNRTRAFKQAQDFGSAMFRLIFDLCTTDERKIMLRYLLV